MKRLKVLAVADPAVVSVVAEEEIIKGFERETGIEIDMDVLPWAEYYASLMASFESYQYDVVMVAGHLWLYDFVKNGFIKEVDDHTEGYDYEDILKTIRKEIEFEGKHYLYPFFCDGHMLLYRKSSFGELPDVVGMKELVKLVESREAKDQPFVQKAHVSEIFQDVLPYFRSEGVEPFDDTGIHINTPESIKALKQYIVLKSYCDPNVDNFGNEEVLDQIQKGECQIGITWSGQIGQVMNENCVEPEDIGFASLDTSWNVSWCFGINKYCQDDASAKAFLEYITGKTVDKWVGYYCGNPVRQSTFDAGMQDNTWYKKVLMMINRAKPVVKSDKTGKVMGIIAQAVHDAYTGKVEAEEALKCAEKHCMELE